GHVVEAAEAVVALAPAEGVGEVEAEVEGLDLVAGGDLEAGLGRLLVLEVGHRQLVALPLELEDVHRGAPVRARLVDPDAASEPDPELHLVRALLRVAVEPGAAEDGARAPGCLGVVAGSEAVGDEEQDWQGAEEEAQHEEGAAGSELEEAEQHAPKDSPRL